MPAVRSEKIDGRSHTYDFETANSSTTLCNRAKDSGAEQVAAPRAMPNPPTLLKNVSRCLLNVHTGPSTVENKSAFSCTKKTAVWSDAVTPTMTRETDPVAHLPSGFVFREFTRAGWCDGRSQGV